ncbi:MAG: chemotaxis protein CheW [Gallionella sp.]|jgi:purine-binding chemotaxis protein CheW
MISYLLFSLNGARYGVEAQLVLEITWLPELSHAEEAPPYIAGLVNLRGKIEPVMNLGQRLGHSPVCYRLSDSIVMLHADGVTMGIIVNEVSDVLGIPASQIEPPQRYDGDTAVHFVAGNAKVGEEIIMLLDVQRLIHAPVLPTSGVPDYPQTDFYPDATERAIFRTRAHNLMQVLENLEVTERIPLSIIELGAECFGVGLEVVREFAHLRRVTVIPCCPPHIAGNMNLRGDILTLVDIRGLLNIPAGSSAAEVIVIESGELSIGVPVDKVLEVIYLRPADIAFLPAAAHEERNEYCKGVTHYGEGMVSILDMQKILTQGGLEVEEDA